MNTAIQTREIIKKENKPIRLSWVENDEVKNLLDVISDILAEEFIQIAKENSSVFTDAG